MSEFTCPVCGQPPNYSGPGEIPCESCGHPNAAHCDDCGACAADDLGQRAPFDPRGPGPGPGSSEDGFCMCEGGVLPPKEGADIHDPRYLDHENPSREDVCASCPHSLFQHGFSGNSRQCVIYGCQCQEFTKQGHIERYTGARLAELTMHSDPRYEKSDVCECHHQYSGHGWGDTDKCANYGCKCQKFRLQKTAEFTPGDTSSPLAERATPNFNPPTPRGKDPWLDVGDVGLPENNSELAKKLRKKLIPGEQMAGPTRPNYPGNGLMSEAGVLGDGPGRCDYCHKDRDQTRSCLGCWQRICPDCVTQHDACPLCGDDNAFLSLRDPTDPRGLEFEAGTPKALYRPRCPNCGVTGQTTGSMGTDTKHFEKFPGSEGLDDPRTDHLHLFSALGHKEGCPNIEHPEMQGRYGHWLSAYTPGCFDCDDIGPGHPVYEQHIKRYYDGVDPWAKQAAGWAKVSQVKVRQEPAQDDMMGHLLHWHGIRPYQDPAFLDKPTQWVHMRSNRVYGGDGPEQMHQIAHMFSDPKDVLAPEFQHDHSPDPRYPNMQGPPVKTGMANRTGHPEIDKAISDFLDEPMGDWTTDNDPIRVLSDPSRSHGSCQSVAEQFADFAKKRGLNAYATPTDVKEMGYRPHGKPQGEVVNSKGEIVPGFYHDHTVNEIYVPGENFPYTVDFTASQYGYKDHPKVSAVEPELCGHPVMRDRRDPRGDHYWCKKPATHWYRWPTESEWEGICDEHFERGMYRGPTPTNPWISMDENPHTAAKKPQYGDPRYHPADSIIDPAEGEAAEPGQSILVFYDNGGDGVEPYDPQKHYYCPECTNGDVDPSTGKLFPDTKAVFHHRTSAANRDESGFNPLYISCPKCRGGGKGDNDPRFDKSPCRNCHGYGGFCSGCGATCSLLEGPHENCLRAVGVSPRDYHVFIEYHGKPRTLNIQAFNPAHARQIVNHEYGGEDWYLKGVRERKTAQSWDQASDHDIPSSNQGADSIDPRTHQADDTRLLIRPKLKQKQVERFLQDGTYPGNKTSPNHTQGDQYNTMQMEQVVGGWRKPAAGTIYDSKCLRCHKPIHYHKDNEAWYTHHAGDPRFYKDELANNSDYFMCPDGKGDWDYHEPDLLGDLADYHRIHQGSWEPTNIDATCRRCGFPIHYSRDGEGWYSGSWGDPRFSDDDESTPFMCVDDNDEWGNHQPSRTGARAPIDKRRFFQYPDEICPNCYHELEKHRPLNEWDSTRICTDGESYRGEEGDIGWQGCRCNDVGGPGDPRYAHEGGPPVAHPKSLEKLEGEFRKHMDDEHPDWPEATGPPEDTDEIPVGDLLHTHMMMHNSASPRPDKSDPRNDRRYYTDHIPHKHTPDPRTGQLPFDELEDRLNHGEHTYMVHMNPYDTKGVMTHEPELGDAIDEALDYHESAGNKGMFIDRAELDKMDPTERREQEEWGEIQYGGNTGLAYDGSEVHARPVTDEEKKRYAGLKPGYEWVGEFNADAPKYRHPYDPRGTDLGECGHCGREIYLWYNRFAHQSEWYHTDTHNLYCRSKDVGGDNRNFPATPKVSRAPKHAGAETERLMGHLGNAHGVDEENLLWSIVSDPYKDIIHIDDELAAEHRLAHSYDADNPYPDAGHNHPNENDPRYKPGYVTKTSMDLSWGGYDPVRSVSPSSDSAPAPSAQGSGGDPWVDLGDNGTAPPRPGYIRDKKLKKWVKDTETWPESGPLFGDAGSDANKVGAKVSDPYEGAVLCTRCIGDGDVLSDDGDPRYDPDQGDYKPCPACKGWGFVPHEFEKQDDVVWCARCGWAATQGPHQQKIGATNPKDACTNCDAPVYKDVDGDWVHEGGRYACDPASWDSGGESEMAWGKGPELPPLSSMSFNDRTDHLIEHIGGEDAAAGLGHIDDWDLAYRAHHRVHDELVGHTHTPDPRYATVRACVDCGETQDLHLSADGQYHCNNSDDCYARTQGQDPPEADNPVEEDDPADLPSHLMDEHDVLPEDMQQWEDDDPEALSKAHDSLHGDVFGDSQTHYHVKAAAKEQLPPFESVDSEEQAKHLVMHGFTYRSVMNQGRVRCLALHNWEHARNPAAEHSHVPDPRYAATDPNDLGEFIWEPEFTAKPFEAMTLDERREHAQHHHSWGLVIGDDRNIVEHENDHRATPTSFKHDHTPDPRYAAKPGDPVFPPFDSMTEEEQRDHGIGVHDWHPGNVFGKDVIKDMGSYTDSDWEAHNGEHNSEWAAKELEVHHTHAPDPRYAAKKKTWTFSSESNDGFIQEKEDWSKVPCEYCDGAKCDECQQTGTLQGQMDNYFPLHKVYPNGVREYRPAEMPDSMWDLEVEAEHPKEAHEKFQLSDEYVHYMNWSSAGPRKPGDPRGQLPIKPEPHNEKDASFHREQLYGGGDWYMPCSVCGKHLQDGEEAWVRDEHDSGDPRYDMGANPNGVEAQCLEHRTAASVLPQSVGDHDADNGIEDPMKRGDKGKTKKIYPGTQKADPTGGEWNISVDNLNKTSKTPKCGLCGGTGVYENTNGDPRYDYRDSGGHRMQECPICHFTGFAPHAAVPEPQSPQAPKGAPVWCQVCAFQVENPVHDLSKVAARSWDDPRGMEPWEGSSLSAKMKHYREFHPDFFASDVADEAIADLVHSEDHEVPGPRVDHVHANPSPKTATAYMRSGVGEMWHAVDDNLTHSYCGAKLPEAGTGDEIQFDRPNSDVLCPECHRRHDQEEIQHLRDFRENAEHKTASDDEDDGEYYSRCPACGDPSDYCRGGGPESEHERILALHDSGFHDECAEEGCDEKINLSREPNDPRGPGNKGGKCDKCKGYGRLPYEEGDPRAGNWSEDYLTGEGTDFVRDCPKCKGTGFKRHAAGEDTDLLLHLIRNHGFPPPPDEDSIPPLLELQQEHEELHMAGENDHNPEVLKVAHEGWKPTNDPRYDQERESFEDKDTRAPHDPRGPNFEPGNTWNHGGAWQVELSKRDGSHPSLDEVKRVHGDESWEEEPKGIGIFGIPLPPEREHEMIDSGYVDYWHGDHHVQGEMP